MNNGADAVQIQSDRVRITHYQPTFYFEAGSFPQLAYAHLFLIDGDAIHPAKIGSHFFVQGMAYSCSEATSQCSRHHTLKRGFVNKQDTCQ